MVVRSDWLRTCVITAPPDCQAKVPVCKTCCSGSPISPDDCGTNTTVTVREIYSIFLLGLALVYSSNPHVSHPSFSCFSFHYRSTVGQGTSLPPFLSLSFHRHPSHNDPSVVDLICPAPDPKCSQLLQAVDTVTTLPVSLTWAATHQQTGFTISRLKLANK